MTFILFTLNIVACVTAGHDNASEFTLFTSLIALQLLSYTVLLSVLIHSTAICSHTQHCCLFSYTALLSVLMHSTAICSHTQYCYCSHTQCCYLFSYTVLLSVLIHSTAICSHTQYSYLFSYTVLLSVLIHSTAICSHTQYSYLSINTATRKRNKIVIIFITTLRLSMLIVNYCTAADLRAPAILLATVPLS